MQQECEFGGQNAGLCNRASGCHEPNVKMWRAEKGRKFLSQSAGGVFVELLQDVFVHLKRETRFKTKSDTYCKCNVFGNICSLICWSLLWLKMMSLRDDWWRFPVAVYQFREIQGEKSILPLIRRNPVQFWVSATWLQFSETFYFYSHFRGWFACDFSAPHLSDSWLLCKCCVLGALST